MTWNVDWGAIGDVGDVHERRLDDLSSWPKAMHAPQLNTETLSRDFGQASYVRQHQALRRECLLEQERCHDRRS